jgi:hypothetical protein
VSEAAPEAVREALQQQGAVPVGAVVPYFGDPSDLLSPETEPTWVLCDGRTISDAAPLRFDADAEIGGRQIPDLRGSFVRGLEAGTSLSMSGGVTIGGSDVIPPAEHTHSWVSFAGENWSSFQSDGRTAAAFTRWDNGIGNAGEGWYPISRQGGRITYYTSVDAHDHGGDNRPRFVSLHFVCRVR